jgi:hypothetical protein
VTEKSSADSAGAEMKRGRHKAINIAKVLIPSDVILCKLPAFIILCTSCLNK